MGVCGRVGVPAAGAEPDVVELAVRVRARLGEVGE
jgi:hypothetical protein